MGATLTVEDSDQNYRLQWKHVCLMKYLKRCLMIPSLCQSSTPIRIHKFNVKQDQMVGTRTVEDLD